MKSGYKILVGKPEEKRPFRRLGCAWENDTKWMWGERDLEGMDCIHVARDRNRW
jgi:hypothetical protein